MARIRSSGWDVVAEGPVPLPPSSRRVYGVTIDHYAEYIEILIMLTRLFIIEGFKVLSNKKKMSVERAGSSVTF
jgi:hypothetical protein